MVDQVPVLIQVWGEHDSAGEILPIYMCREREVEVEREGGIIVCRPVPIKGHTGNNKQCYLLTRQADLWL